MTTRTSRALVVVAGVLVLTAVVVALLLTGNGDDQATTTTTAVITTTAVAPTTTEAPTTTDAPATTTPAVVDTRTAVWPTVDSDIRYNDPVVAASGFATFVGFLDPIVGPFLMGDPRSGEVEIRPTANGPATTVFVRQLEDGNWWVLGSATGSIRLDAPGAGETVTTPVRLTGAANAFEGHVSVTIIQDGSATPVATGFVTGAMGEMGPFDTTLAFSRPPTGRYGAIVLTTTSMEDGRLWEAGVVRIRFGRPA
jgi:hypothetical protein